MGDGKFTLSRVVVRYQETDQMGVAHHSVYPVWFEVARTDLIKQYGLTYSQMEADGIMLPVLEITCTYKGFARYEDALLVRASVGACTKTRLDFVYAVSREAPGGAEGELIAQGASRHVFTTTLLKPVNLQKLRPDLWEILSHAT